MEDELVGWHHRLDAHEFGQAPGVDDGQGSLAFCSPLGCKELDTTEQLNCTEKVKISLLKTIKGDTLYPLPMSMSEAFSVPVYPLIKLCYTKALE